MFILFCTICRFHFLPLAAFCRLTKTTISTKVTYSCSCFSKHVTTLLFLIISNVIHIQWQCVNKMNSVTMHIKSTLALIEIHKKALCSNWRCNQNSLTKIEKPKTKRKQTKKKKKENNIDDWLYSAKTKNINKKK